MGIDAGCRVCVVMIFRDPELSFFAEAIDSVLAQSQPGVELLLCDDGSGAEATDLARSAAAAHPDRVRWLEHPGHARRGMSAARNLGIGAARAPMVAFLDADDVWLPGHLEHEVALLDEHPEAGFVCGRALDWYSWRSEPGYEPPEDRWSPLAWPAGTVVPPVRMVTAVLRRGAYSTPTCSLLVRRQLLTEVGGAEDEFTGMFEDQVLLAKLYLSGSWVVSGAQTAHYRRHPGSASALAEHAGSYHPNAPNPSMLAYLRWLAARPQIAGTDPDRVELRARLNDLLDCYDRPAEAEPLRRRAEDAFRARLPAPARAVLRRARAVVAGQQVRFGSLRRTTPLSRQFGYDRGQPIDRHYIEDFLAEHAQLINGRVLEVGDGSYARQFGGDRVSRLDVLNIAAGDPETTIVADLADAAQIPSEQFDCLLITQTLQLVYDLPAAAATLRRILKPGGTLLTTVPGISPVSTDRWADSWYWSLTPHAARRLFETEFGVGQVEVATRGNVLTSIAFLTGLASHELSATELAAIDPQFPMLVTVRADRPVDPAESEDPDATERSA